MYQDLIFHVIFNPCNASYKHLNFYVTTINSFDLQYPTPLHCFMSIDTSMQQGSQSVTCNLIAFWCQYVNFLTTGFSLITNVTNVAVNHCNFASCQYFIYFPSTVNKTSTDEDKIFQND
eukprot:GHVU01140633.1.p1 GENE.GHVU01140633.1~~GHVU01140633.1.p1  ORF type:complete len:119 (-),score=3.26 GHVU01140633.1:477-833(-)